MVISPNGPYAMSFDRKNKIDYIPMDQSWNFVNIV